MSSDDEKSRRLIQRQRGSGENSSDSDTRSPTGRLVGKTPTFAILDSPPIKIEPINWPDIDYSEIEKRVLAAGFGSVDLSQMTRAIEQFGSACKKLSGAELGTALHKYLEDNPELLMTKHERQHANHPTEKNPNHPRFQQQPHRARKRR